VKKGRPCERWRDEVEEDLNIMGMNMAGRQCTYNITQRRVLATVVHWRNNNYYIVCVCV